VTFVAILPMAFVMIAGPQIISAVFLATSVDWPRNSGAYLAGAALSITLFVTAAYIVTRAAKGDGGSPATGSTGDTIDIVILVLLVFLAVYVFLHRTKADPPKWMGKLQTASPRFSFSLGLLLLGVFPTDIVTSVTVGVKVAREGEPWLAAVPFILLTLSSSPFRHCSCSCCGNAQRSSCRRCATG
jgi:Sap, sulfolipid-1-addressing protein